MSIEETVELRLKFPKPIIDFLEAMNENVEEYIVQKIVEVIESELDADVFWDPKELVKKYNLMAVFEKHGVSVSSYLNPEKPY